MANTTKSIGSAAAKETAITELEAQVKAAAAAFKGEKLVKVSIPKVLEKHIGPVLYVGVQGVSIVLPVDGNDYEVPATFRDHVKQYLDNLQS
jgi:hypothetical protein